MVERYHRLRLKAWAFEGPGYARGLYERSGFEKLGLFFGITSASLECLLVRVYTWKTTGFGDHCGV
jgi:hypothetical protein